MHAQGPPSNICRSPRLGGFSNTSSPSISSDEDIEASVARRKETSNIRWWRRERPGRTTAAFNRWAARQRKPVSKKLLSSIIALIAILSVSLCHKARSDIPIAKLLPSTVISLLSYYTMHYKRLIPRNDIQRIISTWGNPNTPTAAQTHYPTDFSRDIAPIPCHSHNDYWRRVPLYDALSAGCISIEVDVWYTPTDLLVGHTASSLTQDRSLKSLYVDSLVSILTHQNPSPGLLNTTGTSRNGVFDTSPTTPITLLIDIKTDATKTFPVVLEHLEPFRSRGWLTHYNGSAVIPGLITVVATGNTPFDLLTANTTYRDVFYDAPLADFWSEDPVPIAGDYTSENSYYASTDFKATVGSLWHGVLSPRQVELVRAQVKEAKARGLIARYWNTPSWPVRLMEHVWDVLEKEGVGILNVDDLDRASRREWGG
ncbi:MAG: hypothetical protein Q9163_003639 [Psora crenata]